jgi:hypothetical protein
LRSTRAARLLRAFLSAARGKNTSNFEPLPTSVVTQITPPLCSTMPYTVASPSPVPRPGALVVKNGSKILLMVSGVDARAVVAHRDADVTPSAGSRDRARRARGRCAAFEVAISIVPPPGSASRALTTRLNDHLVELRRVDLDQTELGGELERHRDVLAEQAPQERSDRAQHFVGVEHARRQHLSPAERELLARDVGGARAGLADLDEVVAELLAAVALVLAELREAEDRRQHVVEVVRDSAREPADRLHLLRLAQLGLARPQASSTRLTSLMSRPTKKIRRRLASKRGRSTGIDR